MVDSKEYNKFLNKVKNGEIKTEYNKHYYILLDMEFNSIGIEYNIDIIDKYSFDLEIFKNDLLDNNTLKYIISLIKQKIFVYPIYISFIDNLKERKEKYNDKYLDIKYDNIKITFTCKYDDGLYSNDIEIPDTMYYISRTEEIFAIRNNYLSPKINYEKTYPRIYFFNNLDEYENILENMKRNDIKTEYNLYEVKIPQYSIIHKEPNFKYGFYILNLIELDDIKLLKEKI